MRQKEELRSSDRWTLWHLVFTQLSEEHDAESMARAGCVCREWREVASLDVFWKQLCLARWPSLCSGEAQCLVATRLQGAEDHHGFFRRLFVLRAQAETRYRRRVKGGAPGALREAGDAALQAKMMAELVFLLDVRHKGQAVCSLARAADTLSLNSCHASACGTAHEDCNRPEARPFDLVAGLQPATSVRRAWSRQEVREFEVSWAVLWKGRVLQLLQRKPARGRTPARENAVLVGDTCTYVGPLPASGSGNAGHVVAALAGHTEVDVKVDFECERHVETSASGSRYTFGDFKPACASFSFMSTSTWTCVSQPQALAYLHYCMVSG